MSTSPDESTDEGGSESLLAALRLFESYSVGVHVAALVSLFVLWCGLAYVLFESGVVTASPAADTPSGRADRRLVGGVTGFIVGGVLGVMTLRSIGGPVVNALLSGAYSVLGPLVLFPVVYGTLPAVYSQASNRFAVETLLATVPGLVGFFVFGWMYAQIVWSPADRERWLDTLPENPVVKPTERE